MNLIPKAVVALILLALPAHGEMVTANFTSATTVPVTAASYTATGNTVNFSLNFAPPAGTNLTVVKNTGLEFIQGTFDNLAQGQAVNLTYGGINYPFVANYYGGSGNSLVLQWANNRIVAWGSNSGGALGNNSTEDSKVPVAVDGTGVLAGKSVIALACGNVFTLGLLADGTLVGWGLNTSGQLGNTTTTDSTVPVAVSQTGVLAGKTVIAVAAGGYHSLALCADGTLAAWGSNIYGQLGINSTNQCTVPVLVNQTGVLAGKTVVAIAAGEYYSLALCADGSLAAWGDNGNGQLGDNSTAQSSVPVLVNQTGVLAGKSICAIAAGKATSMALCTDGTLAAWGSNYYGQLGNNSTTDSKVPVRVDQTGVLAGKTVTDIAVSVAGYHALACCADGTAAAWGYNNSGQLGNNSTAVSLVPVLVNTSGALAGRKVIDVACGSDHGLAACAEGTMAAWGLNSSGQLGNNSTTNSLVPVSIDASGLGTGERIVAARSGWSFSLAMVARPPAPQAVTLAASGIKTVGATLNGSANAQGTTTSLSFEYGLTNSYGTTVAAAPAAVAGTTTTTASTTISGLVSGTTYHYRIIATNPGGTTKGQDMTFSTNDLASLTDLSLSAGTLVPSFASKTVNYVAAVPNATASIRLTPVCTYPGATIKVNGTTVASGTASNAINLAVGDTVITIIVTSADGVSTETYSVKVTRLPSVFTFASATTVPVTVADFVATGLRASFALNFAPVPGTNLTAVRNTGLNPIQGRFDNLAQGQTVNLTYGGITYAFVANYFGGTGNDLVLQWANVRLLAWGGNSNGELGNNSTSNSSVPVPVDMSGVLAGKTIVRVAEGGSHSLALCADGTLAAWGDNTYGQLGNNSRTNAKAPVLVDRTGVLAGKTISAIAAGPYHSHALCSDGTVVELAVVSAALNQTGVLAGKTVVAIASGGTHDLGLCSDGTVFAWGTNDYGQLGNNSTTASGVPVLVDRTGVLAGKTVVAIAAGGNNSLVLCSDGTLASWGYNMSGELGYGDQIVFSSKVPVPVSQTGVLAGKTVVAIASGPSHSIVLCSDGTLAAWGHDNSGSLGIGNIGVSYLPVLVTRTGVLAGKTVLTISAGNAHSLAVCTDGTMAAWGNNYAGALGNNSTTSSNVPVLVNTSTLATGERFVAAGGGSVQTLAMVASPPQALATALDATDILDSAATLNGTVNASGNTTTVAIEYGLTTSYGTTLVPSPATVSGTTTTAVSATVSGLLSGTTYHYRVVATNAGGTVRSSDMTFTTTTHADLASLALSDGTLMPPFAGITRNYSATVPYATVDLTITPVCVEPTSQVKVNGVTVASGTAHGPLSLAVGNNAISVVVSSAGETNVTNYTVTVTRLPETFTFNSATDVPVTASDFAATGMAPELVLTFAPPQGTNLTVVNNTGPSPIHGTFANLSQGQAVNLTYGGITYPFVADYYGGTGNDLVLQWAITRIVAWGGNTFGQLGNNSTSGSSVAVPVTMSGVLVGKKILGAGNGGAHSLVRCSDGTLATWGYNNSGQLGNGSNTISKVPALVNLTGVLAGKLVVATSCGVAHTLALCADGTLATWGYNTDGELGNNTTTNSNVPVVVNQAGVLAGKTVSMIAAGGSHNLVLCADGSLAAWGSNAYGQLGGGITSNRSEPVLVNQGGVLAGKTVVAISVGESHCLALCSDGTVATWGYNAYGQLGNNSTTNSSVPVLLNQTGVLAGRTIVAIAAGGGHSLALCADGTMAAWGYNYYGQLGNNTTTNSSVPVLVTRTGVLAGKTILTMSAGATHTLVTCADGTMAAWGCNSSGQLGNSTMANSSVPVLVTSNGLGVGERFVAASGGLSHSLALVAIPLPGIISGFVLNDSNSDGAGDAPLTGVVLTLKDSNGNDIDSDPLTTGVQPTTSTTAADGSYSFPNLSPGNYRVVATRPPGYLGASDVDGGNLDTIGDVKPIAVLPASITANQTFVMVQAAGLGNLVWFDTNRNGKVDPGEPGLPGVTVRLYKSTQTPGVDTPVASTVTDAAGTYAFAGLYPGDYVVYLPVPSSSAPTLSLVQDHNDDRIDNDNNGSQTVAGAPVSSPVINIRPGENDLTIDFGFTRYYTWQEWQYLNPLGGKNQPGDNPDGDNHDNLIEFAFNLPPDSGAGSPFSIKPSTSPTSRVELGFTRPTGATTSVTYYLEYSRALGAATSWIPIPLTTISPRNIDIATIDDLTERVTIRNFEAREGFVRFRVELDSNDDRITDHISYTGVQGWTESAMELGTCTHNNPYQHEAVFTGTVDADGVSGQTLHFTTSAGTADLGTVLTPGTSYYLEVTAGTNEGQRFDVVSASGSALTLAMDNDVCSDTPPFNTLAGALPATLAGNRIALHRHWTLGELFPIGRYLAGNDDTTADQVQTSAVAATNTYWLCSNNGSPKWVKLGDATLTDQANTVLAPGRGLMVLKRGTAARILAFGAVRSNKFIRPLCAGPNLVGGGWPITQSAAGTGGRQMDAAHGFTGSTDPAAADTFSVWRGDATPGATGYDNYYLYNPGTAPKWVKTGDASLMPVDAEPLFLGDRGVLIQMKDNLYGYTMPSPLGATSLNAATQGTTGMQGLADTVTIPRTASALIDYAFGVQSGSNNHSQLPQGKLVGDNYVIEFTEPTGVTGIIYGAEVSATLLPDSWTAVADTGTGATHIFSVPLAGGKLFMRLKVTGQ